MDMKKFLLGIATLFMMAGCAGTGNSEKERQDSIRTADSIALLKAEAELIENERIAELARQDSIRQDSIRKDSIAKEDKMRITPQTIEKGVNRSALKNLGFIKKVDSKWHEGDLYGEDMKYTRTFNGRRVDYVSWSGGSSDTYFQFYDKQELNDFKEALKKSQFKPAGDGVYASKNHWIKIEGNKVRFDFDW